MPALVTAEPPGMSCFSMTSTFAPASAAAMAADRPAVPLPITSTSHSRASLVFSGASTFAVMASGAFACFSAAFTAMRK